MTTKFLAGLIVSAVLVTSPVAAATQVAAPKNADIGKAASPDAWSGKSAATQEKKVCRQLPSSNSRLPNRVCLTAKEWKQVEAEVER
jgi:hypothetical protein